ncbi:hypothetical protein EV14_0867 [Prochlorococcus sp. MIT 0703]|nr:hypothetical protein EV14_0867 [Prochlorococcus sp. MIT 0703]
MQVALDYVIADGLTLGVNLSHDEAFDTRFSGNISYRFGSNSSATAIEKKAWEMPTIKSLSESVKQRNIRIHDEGTNSTKCKFYDPRTGGLNDVSVAHSSWGANQWWNTNGSYRMRLHCTGDRKKNPGGWEFEPMPE